MNKLKLIEGLYYNPNDIGSGFNVTKELIQMVDVDNAKLYYDGTYNDIFGDPAKRIKKKLKIILEYNGNRYTKIYEEDKVIDLPKDLNLEISKKSFLKAVWDSLIIEPNVFGIGARVKPLFKRLYGEPTLFKKVIVFIIFLSIIAVGFYIWYSPITEFLKDTQKKYFTNYNDPSRVLDSSIFDVIREMEELSTDEEKQLFIQNYSGLRTKGEQGRIVHATTSDTLSIPADIEVNSKILTCDFDKKWKQKLSILGENTYVSFVGVIDRYDIDTDKLLLIYCNLLYR